MGKIYGLLGVLVVMSGPAFAQSPVCERLEGAVCGPAKAAWLGKTLGDVTVLARSASKAMAVGADSVGVALAEGDRVVARAGSSVIDLGPGCLVSVPKSSSAQVYRLDAARICVSVTNLAPARMAEADGGQSGGGEAALAAASSSAAPAAAAPAAAASAAASAAAPAAAAAAAASAGLSGLAVGGIMAGVAVGVTASVVVANSKPVSP
jgi:hypothetical protein